MARKVFVADRSPLAKNVYKMILTNIDNEINVVSREDFDSIDLIKNDAKSSNMVIISERIIGERRKDFFELVRELSEVESLPCILFVQKETKGAWSDFDQLKNVMVVERPFFPDDFLVSVKKVWGIDE